MPYKLMLVYKDSNVTRVAHKWDIPEIITNKKGEVKKVKFIPSTSQIKKALKNDFEKQD